MNQDKNKLQVICRTTRIISGNRSGIEKDWAAEHRQKRIHAIKTAIHAIGIRYSSDIFDI